MAQATVSRPPIAANTIPFPQSQTIAPFPQKLSEIINDTNNHDLIYWSDSGDSFLIPDHEHFARSVLGNWFKHQNWSTFVRQLNIYGFKKIPHLQQGTLRPSEGAEHNINSSQFAHVHFRRAQPELIHLIRRKNKGTRGASVTSTAQMTQIQADEEGDDDDDTTSMDLIHSRDTPHTHNPPSSGGGGGGGGGGNTTATSGNPTLAQLFEILSALKHHQSTLSAEIDTLKRSYHTLRQESIDTRKALARILKFLAGVFGGYVRANPGLHQQTDNDNDMAGFGSYNNNKAVVPHRGNRTARLMIEGGDPAQEKENHDELSRRFVTEVGSMNSLSPYDIPVQAQGVVMPLSDNGQSPITTDNTTTDPCANNNNSLTRVQSESGVSNHQTTKDTSTTSSTTASASTTPGNAVETPYNPHQPTGYELGPDGLHHQHTFGDLTPAQLAHFWMSLPQNMDAMNDSLAGLHFSSDLMVPPPPLTLPLLPTTTTTTMFGGSPIPEPNAGAGLGPTPGPKTPEGLISFNDIHPVDTTPPSYPHGTLLSSSPFDIDIPPPRTEYGVELDLEKLLNSGGDTSIGASVNIWPDPMDETDMGATTGLGWGVGRIGDSSGSGTDVLSGGPVLSPAGIEGRGRNAGMNVNATPRVGVTRPKRKSDAMIGEALDSGGMGTADPKRRRV